MAEPILKKYTEIAQAESNPTEPNTDDDINIELSKEFLMELKNNAYHRMFDEDVVDHIAKVLELLDLIKIPGVDSHRLRMKMNRSWNKRRMDDNILNNNEWKKSDYGNPLNTATDSFFKAHDEHDIKEGNKMRQMKRKEDNKNDEKPNKRVCKAKNFEAIKYSLGPNEEYIAIRRCEYNAWERNEDRPRCKEIDEVGEVSII
ncbi:hypothetical protein Tco_0587634 [Tanacetum coccineum]